MDEHFTEHLKLLNIIHTTVQHNVTLNLDVIYNVFEHFVCSFPRNMFP